MVEEGEKDIKQVEDLVSRDVIKKDGKAYVVMGYGPFAYERLAREIDLDKGILGEFIYVENKDVPTLKHLFRITTQSYDSLFNHYVHTYSI